MKDTKKELWPGWETVGIIGRGSFGTVFEIQRDIFGDIEKAALKIISIPLNEGEIDELYSYGYDDETITATFADQMKSVVAEYSMMRKMSDERNVVTCDDIRYVKHDDGIGWDIFIKMELLTSVTKAYGANVADETVIALGADICQALVVCGELNIIHRDIKPQNIFVSSKGVFKLGDFGIAKTVEGTMGGTRIGTYKFIAPEVFNNSPYGARADIYSLGLVLYWLLNERRIPFAALPPQKPSYSDEEQAKSRRLAGEELPPPMHGSEELKAIVLKACAYDPKDRYASAKEMLEALDGLRRGETVSETTKELLSLSEEEGVVELFEKETELLPEESDEDATELFDDEPTVCMPYEKTEVMTEEEQKPEDEPVALPRELLQALPLISQDEQKEAPQETETELEIPEYHEDEGEEKPKKKRGRALKIIIPVLVVAVAAALIVIFGGRTDDIYISRPIPDESKSRVELLGELYEKYQYFRRGVILSGHKLVVDCVDNRKNLTVVEDVCEEIGLSEDDIEIITSNIEPYIYFEGERGFVVNVFDTKSGFHISIKTKGSGGVRVIFNPF